MPETPKLNGVRLLIAVGRSTIAKSGSLPVIAILEILSGLVGAACAEIDAQHRLGSRELAPVDEFVRSKRVGLRTHPGKIKTLWPFIFRAHAIFPIAARHIVASGVSNDRWSKFPHEVQDVTAKTAGVRGRVTGFKNAGVDTTSHVFNERAKKATVELGNAEIRIDDYSGFFVHGKSSSGYWG